MPTVIQNIQMPLTVAQVNGLVYELYFLDELHAVRPAGAGLCDLVAQVTLPDVSALPEADRLSHLRQKFEELHPAGAGAAHPLLRALEKLSTLQTIRIIEGKS
jgi:hypothetical protein